MLKVEGVTKRYGKTLANDDISFSVEDGQIAVLMGPNGAGKSTMIKCIVGLLRFQGKITLNGYDNKSVEAKAQIGYIPEMPAVYDLLTVQEHMQFILRAYRKLENLDYAQAQLSKGMQQKLSIACALVHSPRVVIFDEPLVGLDPHAIKELKAIFQELRQGGASVLISTHMIDSVEDSWDVAHIMVQGRFAATMANQPSEMNEKTLEQLFFEITEGREEGR